MAIKRTFVLSTVVGIIALTLFLPNVYASDPPRTAQSVYPSVTQFIQAKWNQAQVEFVRPLAMAVDARTDAGALLWKVTQSGKTAGYAITDESGQAIIEYGEAPKNWLNSTADFAQQTGKESWVYAAPGVLLRPSADGHFINVENGEIVPDGTIQPRWTAHGWNVQFLSAPKAEVTRQNFLAALIRNANGESRSFSLVKGGSGFLLAPTITRHIEDGSGQKAVADYWILYGLEGVDQNPLSPDRASIAITVKLLSNGRVFTWYEGTR